jgi:exodeoxyribonuclease-3
MNIATWNINSLRVRLPHVLEWLEREPVDVLALQETKVPDDKFPVDALREVGYGAVFHGQPTYNGVALLGRLDTVGEASDVRFGNPLLADDQMRLITARFADLDVHCAYFPNGQEVGSPKFAYKLGWIDALHAWLERNRSGVPRVLVGDFNIAPDDRDVHDPAAWAGKIHCSEPERERFRALVAAGFIDAFRCFDQPERAFSWWDYRMLAFRRNAGLRIDIALVDERIAGRIRGCRIDREPRKREKPSDHAPVVLELAPA